MNISRKEFFKAGGAAAALAGLGIRPARAQVQPHNWDGFNFGTGPTITDRLNQGPFPVPGNVVMTTTPSREVVPNYGMGLVTYVCDEAGPPKIKGESLEKSLEKLAELPLGHKLLSGEPAVAITELRRALSMGEEDTPVLFNLGNAYYLQKDFTQAVRYFQMATARDTTNPEVYYNLGNAYASQGNFTAAIPAYKKAISQNQDEPDYFNNLAMSYSALGQFDQALAVINDGLKLHGQSELLRENAARIRSGK